MDESTDLTACYDEILALVAGKGLSAIRARITPGSGNPIVVWDEENAYWDEFINAAAAGGASVVTISVGHGDGEHTGQIAWINMEWIEGGVIHSLRQSASWASTGDLPHREDNPVARGRPWAPRKRRSVKDLDDKSDDELVSELVNFGLEQFPGATSMDFRFDVGVGRAFWHKRGVDTNSLNDPDLELRMRRVEAGATQKISELGVTKLLDVADEELAAQLSDYVSRESAGSRPALADEHPVYAVRDAFWSSRGARSQMADPRVRLKVRRVESIVQAKYDEQRRLHQEEEWKREKERLPEIAKHCAEWSRGIGVKRLTKTNLEFFLSTNELQVSKRAREELYNQVNFQLHNPPGLFS